jgi:hypothetical protein
MTGFDDDRELDDFLAHRSALHRRLADRDGSEPPPELDRLVLNKAREAIDVPAHTPMYRAPRWALPVALAATVVLALAVVMNFARVQHRAGYPVAASASPAAEAAPALADAQSFPMAPPPEAPERELAKQRVSSFSAEPSTDALAAPPLQAKTSRAREAGAPHETAPLTAALTKPHSNGAVQMPAEVKAASDASAVTGAAVAGRAGDSQPAGPLVANNSPRFARAEVATEGRIVPARDIALSKQEMDRTDATASRRGGAETATVNAMSAAATSEAYAPPQSAPAAVTLDKAKRADPHIWLQEIERLRGAGKTADADRELAEFRKAFPNEVVPRAAATRDPRPAK